MKLIGICIKKYGKIFEEQIINLSPEYHLDFSFESNEIKITKKDDIILGAYGESIYSISAIVGRNGTGKSSLLNLIGSNSIERAYKGTSVNFSSEDSFACIYISDAIGEGELFFAEVYNLCIQNISRKHVNQPIYDFFFKRNTDSDFCECEAPQGKINTVVYISDKRDYYEYDNLKYIEGSLERGDIISKNKDYPVPFEYLYRSYILLKQQNAIKSDLLILFQKDDKVLEKRSSFDLPEIEFETQPVQENNLVEKIDESIGDFFRKLFVDFINYIQMVSECEKTGEVNYIEFRDNVEKINPIDAESYDKCFCIFKEYFEDNCNDSVELCEGIEQYQRLFFALFELEDVISSRIDSFVLNMSKLKRESAIDLMKILDGCMQWSHLYIHKSAIRQELFYPFFMKRLLISNGEENLLILIANLMGEVKNYCSNQTLPNCYLDGNVIVLVDEIEQGMHPEWCRNLVKYLVDAINNIEIEIVDELGSVSSLNNKAQLILSTHSPYILSDIVTDTNVFLECDNDRTVAKSQNQKTFAANPIELLKNDFFVNGYMGSYSNEIIKKVIAWINDSSGCSYDDEGMRKMVKLIIDQIGEPILRAKLAQMYDEKIYKEQQGKKLAVTD